MKMELFEERIVEAKKRIQDADYIIIGAGAGYRVQLVLIMAVKDLNIISMILKQDGIWILH